MIFIIPIILGAAALATAAFGAVKGVEGFSDMQEAEEIGKKAQKRHERAVSRMEADGKDTQKLATVGKIEGFFARQTFHFQK